MKDDPAFADSLAHLVFHFLEALIKGRRETEKLINSLKDGIEWFYPYTGANRAAFKAYLLYLERRTEVQDNPENLMKGAIQRAIAGSKRSSASNKMTEFD